MVDDEDARTALAWMKAHSRPQDWRALDPKGKPRVYRRRMCEVSRNKLRIALNLPPDRLDAALKALCEAEAAMPLGRMMPIESNQAVELWIILP